ncbi:MAG: NADH-quinone oxidoreductase subunit J [Enterobacteriaceae bacterium]|nr:NADH-quinone oxidoreductase subunit J [Enterobacteriaceae bacterium]
MQQVLFYVFSGVAIFSSILVVLSSNTIRSVLFLILSFVSTACLWLLLEAEFLAVTLILVYVGAVIVLFLFVVMMIDQEFEITKIGVSKYSPIIIVTSIFMLTVLISAMNPYDYGDDIAIPEIRGSGNNIKILGTLLYSKHLFVFEIAGILLLVGMVAAIAISFRGKQDRASQDISEQVDVISNKRIKLVRLDDSNLIKKK